MTIRARSLVFLIPLALLVVITTLLFYKTTGFDFISTWDDGSLITQNPHLQELTAENIWHLLTSVQMTMYLPVQMGTYIIDRAIWGLNPFGFHLTNVILHAINAALVVWLVLRISGQKWLSLWVGALFALHPIQTEAVSWVADRKSLLALLFLITATLSYIHYRSQSLRRYWWLALLLFALGILSKASLIGFPLLLLAYEHLLRPTRAKSKFLAIVPFFFISLAQLILTMKLNVGREAFDITSELLFGTVYPSMLVVYWKYIASLFYPVGLAAYYDTTYYEGFSNIPVLLALAGWLAVIGGILLKGTAQLKFWALWALFLFLPHANIIPHNSIIYADRYLYLSSIGIWMLIGLVVHGGISSVKNIQPTTLVRANAMGLVLLISVLCGLTWQRLDVWRNEVSLWEDAVEKYPNTYLGQFNLGTAYHKAGRYQAAKTHYILAFNIWPNNDVQGRIRMMDYFIERTSPPSR